METTEHLEPQEPKTLEQLNTEYTQCAALVGDMQFKIKFLTIESANLLEKMAKLNHESAILKDQKTPG